MSEATDIAQASIALPRPARLPINRCNLPPQVIGGLTFQQQPAPLYIDGIDALHRALFDTLTKLETSTQRALRFRDYMTANFRLDNLAEAGLGAGRKRANADYLHLLRGWHFNPDGREAAVLRGWVESRFGLLARYHNGRLDDPHSRAASDYLRARCSGLYNTNALEAQLDLLFSYCQYELLQQNPVAQHLHLYRGVNNPFAYDCLQRDGRSAVLLFNNLSSCSEDIHRAGEFGDYLLHVEVPLSKLLYIPELLPGALRGEQEYLVIGGLYRVTVST